MRKGRNVTEKDIFDKRKVYKNEIEPLVRKLKIACSIEKMPMFVTVAVANNENETKYENDMILSVAGVELQDNNINRMLLALNGFKTELPSHIKVAYQTLEDYMLKVATGERNAEETDRELARDFIMEATRIATRQEKIVVNPSSMVPFVEEMFIDNEEE